MRAVENKCFLLEFAHAVWNALPSDLVDSASLNSFKSRLSTDYVIRKLARFLKREHDVFIGFLF